MKVLVIKTNKIFRSCEEKIDFRGEIMNQLKTGVVVLDGRCCDYTIGEVDCVIFDEKGEINE